MSPRRSTKAHALVIISTIAVLLVLLLATAVSAFTASGPVDTVEYRVRPGDTLWAIADAAASEGADVRAMVAAIRDLNDLEGGMIHAGDLLEVPASL